MELTNKTLNLDVQKEYQNEKFVLSGIRQIRLGYLPAGVKIWISTENTGDNLYSLDVKGDGWKDLPEPLYDLYITTKGTSQEKLVLYYSGESSDYYAVGNATTERVSSLEKLESFGINAYNVLSKIPNYTFILTVDDIILNNSQGFMLNKCYNNDSKNKDFYLGANSITKASLSIKDFYCNGTSIDEILKNNLDLSIFINFDLKYTINPFVSSSAYTISSTSMAGFHATFNSFLNITNCADLIYTIKVNYVKNTPPIINSIYCTNNSLLQQDIRNQTAITRNDTLFSYSLSRNISSDTYSSYVSFFLDLYLKINKIALVKQS